MFSKKMSFLPCRINGYFAFFPGYKFIVTSLVVHPKVGGDLCYIFKLNGHIRSNSTFSFQNGNNGFFWLAGTQRKLFSPHLHFFQLFSYGFAGVEYHCGEILMLLVMFIFLYDSFRSSSKHRH